MAVGRTGSIWYEVVDEFHWGLEIILGGLSTIVSVG